MIWLICSGFRIGVVFEDVTPPGVAVAAMVFRRVLRRSAVSSDTIGDCSCYNPLLSG